jgi:hypothetical protein
MMVDPQIHKVPPKTRRYDLVELLSGLTTSSLLVASFPKTRATTAGAAARKLGFVAGAIVTGLGTAFAVHAVRHRKLRWLLSEGGVDTNYNTLPFPSP